MSNRHLTSTERQDIAIICQRIVLLKAQKAAMLALPRTIYGYNAETLAEIYDDLVRDQYSEAERIRSLPEIEHYGFASLPTEYFARVPRDAS